MTIIEFFDINSVENIIATLSYNPDRVILVGHNITQFSNYIMIYKEIAKKRGLKTEFIARSTSDKSIDEVVETLSQIVRWNDDCVFDIEGGDEILLIAAGIISEQFPDRVRFLKFNIEENTETDCDDFQSVRRIPIELTVEENIKIYAGLVNHNDIGFEDWDLNDDFGKDIFKLWEIFKGNTVDWNHLCEALSLVADKAIMDNSFVLNQFTSVPDWSAHKKRIEQSGILRRLYSYSVITNLRSGSDGLYFDFKNHQIKRCLTKGGSLLELYISFVAKGLTEQPGKPLYNDVRCGVFLNWDDPAFDNDTYDKPTTNEIDVILMRGTVPIFISCKSGYIEIDELYKLSTVAERFGGKYAKKVLVATAPAAAIENLLARAEDMDIKVLTSVTKHSINDIREKISKL